MTLNPTELIAQARMLIAEYPDWDARTSLTQLANALEKTYTECERLNKGWHEANCRVNELMGYPDDNEGDIDIAQRIKDLTRERDEARAEVERLKPWSDGDD